MWALEIVSMFYLLRKQSRLTLEQCGGLPLAWEKPTCNFIVRPLDLWFHVRAHTTHSPAVFATEKNPCIDGPMQFKPMLPKG